MRAVRSLIITLRVMRWMVFFTVGVAYILIRGVLPIGEQTMANETVETTARAVPQDRVEELVGQHGEAQRARIERGLKQVASLWTADDGDDVAQAQFAREHFISNPKELDAAF